MTPTRQRIAAAAVLLILTTGTGCAHRNSGNAGTPAPHASAPSTGAATSTQASSEALGADALASRARDAMGSLTSLTVDGTIHLDETDVTIHLTADRNKNCAGTVVLGPLGEVEIRHTGTNTWIKPDTTFWTSIAKEQGAGSSGAAVAEIFKGRYITGGQDDANLQQITELCGLIEDLTGGDLAPGATKTGTSTVNGTRTITLQTNEEDGTHSTAYIAADGEPYLVRLERTEGSDKGRIDLSGFDKPFTVEAPPADAVIDYSVFQKKAKAV